MIFRRRRSRDLLNAEEAAEMLGISQQRLRQLVAEKKLAAVPLSDRFTAYPVDEVSRLQEARANGRLSTGVAALLDDPAGPLRRTHDCVLRVPWSGGGGIHTVHVRIWQGLDADERPRVVVLVSAADGKSDHVWSSDWEVFAAEIDDQLLGGSGDTAVWFKLRMLGSWGGIELDNVVSYLSPTTSRVRTWWSTDRRRDGGQERFENSTFRRSSIGEVRRLIGSGPIEMYPVAASTSEVIDRWNRHRECVDVIVDSTELGRMVTALRVLDNVQPTHPWYNVAQQAAQDLAHEIRAREEHLDQFPPYDEAVNDSDAVMAARTVRRPYTASEQALVERHHGVKHPWPWSAKDLQDNRNLLGYLRQWIEDVDRYADEPDPQLEAAVRVAMGLLAFYVDTVLTEQRREAGDDALVPDHFYPRAEMRTFRVDGPDGRSYVATLTAAGPTAMQSREARLLTEQVREQESTLPAHRAPRYGHDQAGRLVAVLDVRMDRWDQQGQEDWTFATTLWPHEAPRRGLPDDAELVADGGKGDRAVYVRYASGEMDLLPSRPGRTGDEWNFGYSGGGPTYLESAICRAYALTRRVPLAQVPRRWIEDAVDHSSEDHFSMRIGEITRRVK